MVQECKTVTTFSKYSDNQCLIKKKEKKKENLPNWASVKLVTSPTGASHWAKGSIACGPQFISGTVASLQKH